MSKTVDALQRSLSPVLTPMSWVYGGVMRVREQLYKSGAVPSWEPDAVTVSVGNIGWGGTGKTPVAGWLLDWGIRRGLKPLLLTRGYKAKPVHYPYLVKPGALVEEAGDEPLMLATQHPGATVVVDPERTRAGKWAMEGRKSRLVIMDDGFQHMAVKRHLNLVLLNWSDLNEGWNRVIPAGSWREPASALGRADAFMIKTGPTGFKKLRPHFKERLERFHKPVFSFRLAPMGVRSVVGGHGEPDFNGAPYLLVTGVGDPAAVKRTATNYFGYPPMKHMTFPDHHFYTKTDVVKMQSKAEKLGCAAILCTPKDAVKLGPMCTDEFWQFDLRTSFGPSTINANTPFDVWWNRLYEAIDLRRKDDRSVDFNAAEDSDRDHDQSTADERSEDGDGQKET